MSAEREELVRVERFEELRAGMLTVVKECEECGAPVREAELFGTTIRRPGK